MWQFLRQPALAMGLRVDHWIDDRRDPERSTNAAVKFLRQLYDRFGSWPLALAAYNAGEAAIAAAIERYQTNSYWRLCEYEAGLPWSTTLYVPKIIAAAIIGNNPKAFGFSTITEAPPYRYGSVTVPRSLPMDEIANAIGSDREILADLNPNIRQHRTPPGETHTLRIPAELSVQRAQEQIDAINGGIVRYLPYTVRLGDNDRKLARRFSISRWRLRKINGIVHSRQLRPGLKIIVPNRDQAHQNASNAEEKIDGSDARVIPFDTPLRPRKEGERLVYYQTVAGDTISAIARMFAVPPAALLHWNSLDGDAALQPGLILRALVDRGTPALGGRRVRPG